MILAGGFLLLCVALFWVRTALAAQQVEEKPYLVSMVDQPNPPLPTYTATPTPTPIPTITPTLTPTPVPPTPTIVPSAGRVIRLVIPRINVNRAVVPIDLHRKGGELTWNTDSLFANGNRQDLVGQLTTSVNPGDGGNIVLVGHNYNQGLFSWTAVFVNIHKLKPGDQIVLHAENGGKYPYVVQSVKEVPWRQKNINELQKHQKYLWPKEHEQLTLVTCGGSVLVTWSHRVYVVAMPAK